MGFEFVARASGCTAGNDSSAEPAPQAAIAGLRDDAPPFGGSEVGGMGVTGLERGSVTSCEDKHLQNPGHGGAAKPGAFDRESTATGPDLQTVVDAWPTLPEPVRAGIVAMVRASSEG